MGIHDAYGKKVLGEATNGRFQHWFVEERLTVKYPPSNIVAKLDGMISEDCIVEVEGLNEKQIRGGILDLVFHPRPKKLLVIVPANITNRPEDVEQAYQRLLDILIIAHFPDAFGQVVVLSGTGHNPEECFDADCVKVRQALDFLCVKYAEEPP